MDQVPTAANIVTGFSVRRFCSVPEPELNCQKGSKFRVFTEVFEQDSMCFYTFNKL